MPSTVVHMAFAGLLAAALLGDYFDRRAVAVVFLVTIIPDLDSFASLVSTVGHRTLGHTFVIPIAAGILWFADTRLRDRSFVRERWGQWGVAVGWMSIFCFGASGIALDLFTGGANPFWPIHDQFYRVNGKIELSNQRGIVQNFVDLSRDTGGNGGGGGGGGSRGGTKALGNSSEVFMDTGIDPTEGKEPKNVERIFPVVRSGWQLLVLVVGTSVTGAKLWLVERED
jgi:hypothetical protein